MDGDFKRSVRVTRPTGPILFMLGFLVLVGVVAYFLAQTIGTVFNANPYLNGLILLVLAVGILYTFWQVNRLRMCIDWIDAFISERPGFEVIEPPRLLVSMAGMLRDRETRKSLSPTIVRAILDSIATRLDESREIVRYIASLMIFLGLLGTFWGLSITVPLVVETISNLAPEDGVDASEVFQRLVTNLGGQMRGLGTAFASSLLGLAGSLILGFLEILSGQAQNRFYRELEEALSQITRIDRSEGGGGGGGGFLAETLERNFETMDELTAQLSTAEHRGTIANDRLESAAESLALVAERMQANNDATREMIDSQNAMRAALETATERNKGVLGGMDEGTRAHIDSIDRHILRLIEEVAAGRAEATADMRGEIRTLKRTIEAAARGELEG